MVEDQFPIGMRVLVIEEDFMCLKNLERLLQECQYHVTTAESGITAMILLRENKNNFDLLMINDRMRDTNGFKLLELVGMDLPVILFSSNDDPKTVMRGVLQGACDYLVNPFRMEKLQLIWQHVIRKNMNRKRSNCDTFSSYRRIGLDSTMVTNSYPTTCKKKPRVVWSTDLHSKFVGAVNELGVDKAVPRKILHLMNGGNLTKGHVASHLQKYRLYLKRISNVENQQANMVTDIGRSSDTSYLRTSSLSEVGDYLHTLNGYTEINMHNNLLMMESNPQDKDLVSLPSLENRNIWSSTVQLSGTNSNLPIGYAVPINVVESGGNLDDKYYI